MRRWPPPSRCFESFRFLRRTSRSHCLRAGGSPASPVWVRPTTKRAVARCSAIPAACGSSPANRRKAAGATAAPGARRRAISMPAPSSSTLARRRSRRRSASSPASRWSRRSKISAAPASRSNGRTTSCGTAPSSRACWSRESRRPAAGSPASSASASTAPPRRGGSPTRPPIFAPRCNATSRRRRCSAGSRLAFTKRSAYGRAAPVSPKSGRAGSPSAAGLGGPIRVAGAQGSREGVFEGLDADGRLLMRTAGALETVEAADIFLAPPADGAGGGPPPRAEILDESLDR